MAGTIINNPTLWVLWVKPHGQGWYAAAGPSLNIEALKREQTRFYYLDNVERVKVLIAGARP